MTDDVKAVVRVDGVDFDLDQAPYRLQRQWLVTSHALQIAKGARQLSGHL